MGRMKDLYIEKQLEMEADMIEAGMCVEDAEYYTEQNYDIIMDEVHEAELEKADYYLDMMRDLKMEEGYYG